MSSSLYVLALVAIGLERLFELWISNRNAKEAFAAGGYEIGQSHYPAMCVLHTGLLASCALEVLLVPRAFPGVLGWIAIAVAFMAQSLRYWAITTLGERWNTRIIVWPDKPPVSGGPYRFVRHPNYVAVVLEVAAIPLVHGAFVTAIVFSVLNLALLRIRIRTEEAALGEGYERVFGDRPRFLPKVHS